MGGSIETTGIHLQCIPEKRDTNKMFPGKSYLKLSYFSGTLMLAILVRGVTFTKFNIS